MAFFENHRIAFAFLVGSVIHVHVATVLFEVRLAEVGIGRENIHKAINLQFLSMHLRISSPRISSSPL
jgi:hypothetical protein